MLRLKTLKVKGHRGVINGPDLHFETAGLLLCGGNGTGKSSFVDAIEKVLTGKCGSLDTGDMGLSWDKQGTHIKCHAPAIDLILTDGNSETILNLSSPLATQSQSIQRLVAAAKQNSFILRRRALLEFIITKPVDRYRAIQAFLKLDDFVAFELKLKTMHQTCQNQLASAKSDRAGHERDLLQRFAIPFGTQPYEKTCKEKLNAVLTAANVSVVDNLQNVDKQIDEVSQQLTSFSNMDAYNKLYQLRQSVAEIPNPSRIVELIEAWAGASAARRNEEGKLRGHFYAEVLEKGLQWIREDALGQCPLCNNSIEQQIVEAHVVSQLAANQVLVLAKAREKQAVDDLRKSLQDHCNAAERVSKQWASATAAQISPASLPFLTALRAALGSCDKPVDQIVDADFEVIRAIELDQARQSLLVELDAKLASFPNAERYAKLSESKSSLVAVKLHFGAIRQLSVEVSRLQDAESAINKLGVHAEQARKTVVQQLVDRIAGLADSYYQKIHPNEKIGKPALTVPNRGTGSLDLSSDFYDRRGDPRGYYSEAHLDSLGLCIFLAIRRLHFGQRPELAILVLDDVLGTSDGEHRRGTAELIFESFKDHQVFITTHDRLWFENLKAAAKNSKCKSLLISTWSLDGGPVWGDHLSDFEWLASAEAVNAKPADQVIRAGRLLEEILQNLCSNLEVSVPFRIRGDYTVGPLWDAFRNSAKKNADIVLKVGNTLENIEKLKSLRNWVGAHWNEWAQQLTGNEAQEFVFAVVSLRKSVYCDACRKFIMRIPQLDGVWSCTCEKLRYNKVTRVVQTVTST